MAQACNAMEESQADLDEADSDMALTSSEMHQLEAQRQGGEGSSDEDAGSSSARREAKRHRSRKPTRSPEETAVWTEFEEGVEAQVRSAMQTGGEMPDLTAASQQLAQKLAQQLAEMLAPAEPAAGAGRGASIVSRPEHAAAAAEPEENQADLYVSLDEDSSRCSRAAAASPYARPSQGSSQASG